MQLRGKAATRGSSRLDAGCPVRITAFHVVWRMENRFTCVARLPLSGGQPAAAFWRGGAQHLLKVLGGPSVDTGLDMRRKPGS